MSACAHAPDPKKKAPISGRLCTALICVEIGTLPRMFLGNLIMADHFMAEMPADIAFCFTTLHCLHGFIRFSC